MIFNKIRILKTALLNAYYSNQWKQELKQDISQRIKLLDEKNRLRMAIAEMKHLFRNSDEMGVTKDLYNNESIIVSLTTHSKRIHTVYLVVESLLHQTMRPNKIVLYLDEEEFTSDTIPITLKNQQKRGLEIKYVKNLRSYKKIIFALQDYPESIIITTDDDFIYSQDMIEGLYNAHLSDKNAICCYAARDLKTGRLSDGSISYNQCWGVSTQKNISSFAYSPEGCGGVLYPPHSLYKDVCREDLFMSLAPNCDDLWLKAMSLIEGNTVVIVGNYLGDLYEYNVRIEYVQDIGLKNENLKGRNDTQFEAVFSHYKLMDKIPMH